MVNQHSYEKSPLFISINGSCFKARLGYQGGCPLMPIQKNKCLRSAIPRPPKHVPATSDSVDGA